MSDQVSLVWVLRNRESGKLLTWKSVMFVEAGTALGSVCIFGREEQGLEFAKVLGIEGIYQPSFEALNLVTASSASGVLVNPELMSEEAKALSACIGEV